jgi:chaperonin GroEL
MVGGVSIIHVGGFNETEMREKKDRVDDALHATKAALEEGIVPGGGSALLFVREAITYPKEESADFHLGKNIVYKSCIKPFEQILLNAGVDNSTIYYLYSELGKTGENYWRGVDVKNQTIVDMKESGIIDPYKVTRTALENASSVAGVLLLTECVIVDEKESNKNNELPNYGEF